MICRIFGTHLPCRQFFAPPNSVRHSSEAWCIVWACICVWTAVPCTWQQLLLELSSFKTIFSKCHSRLLSPWVFLLLVHKLAWAGLTSFCHHWSGGVEIHSWQTSAVLFVCDWSRMLLQSPQDHQSSELWITMIFKSCSVWNWATY